MKKRWKILIGVILLIIGIRIALPYLIKDYVNKVINDIEGHQGGIEDVDLSLIRGAYVIESLKIEKTGKEGPVPFVDIDEIDLSVQWKALFNGSIVGEVEFERPRINFVDNRQPAKDTMAMESDTTDWVDALKELMPLRINRLTAKNGEINFMNFTTQPKVNLYLNNLMLKVTNINNAESKSDSLPSSLHLTGTSIGKGNLDLKMKMDLLKSIPDLDGNLKFENVDATSLNDFTKAYAKFDVESGQMNLYSEMVVNDGSLKGYLKPLFKGLKVVDLKKDIKESSFLQSLWEVVVGLFSEGLENQPKDQLGTKIPLEGNVEEPNPEILSTIWNILKNAFIKALKADLEGSVSYAESDDEK